jgi:hypothetical protein
MTNLNTNSTPRCLNLKLSVLYEISNKNVILDRRETHKMEVLIMDRFFEDFTSYELIFVPFRIH